LPTHIPNKLPSLDIFDKKILAILSGDGRISISELARQINLTKTPTQARVRRLETEGYIVGYRAMLDPIRMGLDHVAFVEVVLSDTREQALAEFNQQVAHIGEVEQCHMIAGNFDYLLKVRTHSMSAYRKVLGEKISGLPHVANTKTFVAMQSVKEDTVGSPD
jgi:Lrp/AsnC family leucine-responsive transcriptional regulator